ncbi:MAG: hypothetical protein M3033_12695 [Acidobacteriota bacterium]|nr:hypothetical protein [Acidobacteriota bacterium]
MKKFVSILFYLCLSFFLAANIAASSETKPKRSKRSQEPLKIKVTSWGRTQAEIDAAKFRVERSAAVQTALKNAKYRLISFSYIEDEDKSRPAQVPLRFRVVFYNYTGDRTFVAEGDFAGREEINVREENFEPGVSDEELQAAVDLIKADAKLGALYSNDELRTFGAMPPVSYVDGERLVNIGISYTKTGENRVVGISFKNNKVVTYKGSAPATSRATPESCGIVDAGQGFTPPGTAGQYQLSVSQNGITLWEMLVVRPSISSGNPAERSGIEIRNVKYKGKSVLKRAHVPVLDVQYENDFCGPFRDWQYAENFFNAPAEGATNPADGFRILAAGQVAQTALDSGDDRGNFRGVALYTQDVGFGNEAVLVSEMEAGWYRYIMEWRFAPDGTIRPRFGFGATNDSCVCHTHRHHVYWRFDFNVVSPQNKLFQIERGRKFMQPITNETARLRNYATNRRYLIQNSNGAEGYLLVPNLTDGFSDAFSGGDFWFLRYKQKADGEPDELDDPNSDTGDPNLDVPANFAPWLNNESLAGQDVVVWYAAHFVHSDGGNLLSPDRSGNILTSDHVVGPDLRAVHW